MEQRKGLRLILFPMPLQGHLNPMLELANLLHHQGFSITIIHPQFNPLNPSTYPHFTFHSIPVALTQAEASTSDILAFISLLNIKCSEPFRECLARLLSDNQEPVASLISDLLFQFTQPDSIKDFSCLFLCCLSCISTSAGKGLPPLQDSRLEEPVIELPPLKIKDLPVLKTMDPEKYYELVLALKKETEASHGIIFNTFEDLEGSSLATIRQEFNIPIFPIGPFQKCFPAASASSSMKPNFWRWLGASQQQPTLFVGDPPGLVHGSEWLEPLPSGFLEALNGRAHIVKWAPQRRCLATQLLECFGLTMVGILRWRVLVAVGAWDKRGEIERTVRKIMVEKEGEEIRERIFQLMEKANVCIKQGGSSYQSLEGLVKHILSLEK
ncbi:UDP-Glycosyltransferase superfamily protein, partial [Prunus dulcis]